MSDLSHLDAVARMRRRRLEREALGPREITPPAELFVTSLYASGICMILASLFL